MIIWIRGETIVTPTVYSLVFSIPLQISDYNVWVTQCRIVYVYAHAPPDEEFCGSGKLA